MAPESKRDSFPNHSCSLLPASQLGPISLSKSHLDEAPAKCNSHFNILSSLTKECPMIVIGQGRNLTDFDLFYEGK